MTILYETKDYAIDVFTPEAPVVFNGVLYPQMYRVVNKTTGVMEFASPAYPDCLMMADQMQRSVDTRPWNAPIPDFSFGAIPFPEPPGSSN